MIPILSLAQCGYVPGLIGQCTEALARFYHRQFRLGLDFESETATSMADLLARFDPRFDGFWVIRRGDELLGCAAVDGRARSLESALFRWFFVAESARGTGLGRRLLRTVLANLRAQRYAALHLYTHETLQAATSLYESHGFRRVAVHDGLHWGQHLRLVRFELDLTPSPLAQQNGAVAPWAVAPALP